ncbi:MAG TPA: hypothetical protein VKW06_22275 [Candidatus Angelobacter sp.]|nr:hypothetical protein [Candidatus Angelobacter sp.]
MKTSVDEFNSTLERLSERIEDLETRLAALERRSAVMDQRPARADGPLMPPAHPLQALPPARPGATVAIVGRVFLGIAGAYVLRALAESLVVPQAAVVAIALTYAFAWLVWSSLARADSTARTASALTSALILAPMLWELTVRFQALPPWLTAAVLGCFAILAAALAWKRNLATVVGVAMLAAAATSVVLLVATRDPAPFVAALLMMALASEAAAGRDRWTGLRPIAAVALDFALLAVILVYTRAEGVSPEYQPIAPSVLVTLIAAGFLIYGCSTVLRIVVRSHRIAVFEIGQTVVAFLLVTTGILRISSSFRPWMGAFCLLAAGTAYLAAFTRSSHRDQSRNYHAFATWAVALFLAGSFLLLPESLLGLWLVLAAFVALIGGIRGERMTASFHAAVYLGAGALASGLLEYAGRALVGTFPTASHGWIWIPAAGFIAGYAMVAWRTPVNDLWRQRLLRCVFAVPAGFVATAITVAAALWLLSLLTSVGAPLLAVTRTLIISLAALAFAVAASRTRRIELSWLAYAAIAFCTLKLLFEDLRLGSAGAIAGSLFFYGMVWVLVPRLARRNAGSSARGPGN